MKEASSSIGCALSISSEDGNLATYGSLPSSPSIGFSTAVAVEEMEAMDPSGDPTVSGINTPSGAPWRKLIPKR